MRNSNPGFLEAGVRTPQQASALIERESGSSVSVVIVTFSRREKVLRLLESLVNSRPAPREVIVVDDASLDDTCEAICSRFTQARVLKNPKQLGLAACRNIGGEAARGDFIFFVDDDNIVDPSAIRKMLETLRSSPDVGLTGPVAYYLADPNRVWCAGVQRHPLTSAARFVAHNEMGLEKLAANSERDEFPNAFMVRRDVFRVLGGFDSVRFTTHLTETEFCARLRTLGYRIVLTRDALVWHDIPIATAWEAFKRYVDRERTAFEWERNRIIFMRKYSSPARFLAFLVFLEPLFVAIFVFACLFSTVPARTKVVRIRQMLSGAIDGLLSPSFSKSLVGPV
jgi:GT2 family glycosyltransferase